MLFGPNHNFFTDFKTTMTDLGQIITKTDLTMQSIHIAKTRGNPVRLVKIECKMYPNAVWKRASDEGKKIA